jgi:hypothetical protein
MADSKSTDTSTKNDLKNLGRLCRSHKLNTWLNWPAHIYELLDELCPHLLLCDPVIKAFYKFINSLEKYKSEHYTYYYTKRNKYVSGIILKPDTSGIHIGRIYGMPIHFRIQNTSIENMITNYIYENYLPLYELIKDDLIPAMEKKECEVEKEVKEKKLHKDLEYFNNAIITLKKRYESRIEYYNQCIANIYNKIEKLRAE